MTSPQDVTNYMVFWWKESAEISKSVALDDTKFVIEGLLSNTAYHVVVLVSGPLGNVNSTSEVFYTTPEQIQGKLPNVILSLTLPYVALTVSSQNVVRLFALNKLHSLIFCSTYVCIGPLSVLVLPKQMLKVSWKPSDDAERSLIDYIVTTTTGMDFVNSTSIKHPITSIPISGLPQYSAGTVSVWAKNPGAMSKQVVVLRFRMVNIVTNGRHIITFSHSTTYISIE